MAVALQKRSKHFQSINSIVGRIIETGQFTKWRENTVAYLKARGLVWLKGQKETDVYKKLNHLAEQLNSRTIKPFGLENFVVCFASILLGGLMATVAWVGEIVFFFGKNPYRLKIVRQRVFWFARGQFKTEKL
ncbi:unnamed protein product [Allacma fusca]|uniref:Uncharacterized protein n=1 Tax=Allacma fusca TaxID=39272 RepID=A0A8J2KZH4_9HEXA|nr:unnamed protein product [Allacma fusca]